MKEKKKKKTHVHRWYGMVWHGRFSICNRIRFLFHEICVFCIFFLFKTKPDFYCRFITNSVDQVDWVVFRVHGIAMHKRVLFFRIILLFLFFFLFHYLVFRRTHRRGPVSTLSASSCNERFTAVVLMMFDSNTKITQKKPFFPFIFNCSAVNTWLFRWTWDYNTCMHRYLFIYLDTFGSVSFRLSLRWMWSNMSNFNRNMTVKPQKMIFFSFLFYQRNNRNRNQRSSRAGWMYSVV